MKPLSTILLLLCGTASLWDMWPEMPAKPISSPSGASGDPAGVDGAAGLYEVRMVEWYRGKLPRISAQTLEQLRTQN